jgi:adapter protein MecA 1/2
MLGNNNISNSSNKEKSVFDENLEALADIMKSSLTPTTRPSYRPSHRSNILIYSFKDIDSIINISKQLVKVFHGNSSVYKFKDMYHIVLEGRSTEKALYILNEYGERFSSNIKGKYHLIEHGEIITEEYALEKYSLL